MLFWESLHKEFEICIFSNDFNVEQFVEISEYAELTPLFKNFLKKKFEQHKTYASFFWVVQYYTIKIEYESIKKKSKIMLLGEKFFQSKTNKNDFELGLFNEWVSWVGSQNILNP